MGGFHPHGGGISPAFPAYGLREIQPEKSTGLGRMTVKVCRELIPASDGQETHRLSLETSRAARGGQHGGGTAGGCEG